MTNQNLIHVDTDDFGLSIDRAEDGGLTISVDSRQTFIANLTADAERAVRLGDLYQKSVDLVSKPSDKSARVMFALALSSLIGAFAADDPQFRIDAMNAALLDVADRA